MIAITRSGNNNLRHPPSYSYARSWRKPGSATLVLLQTAAPLRYENHPRKTTGSPSASITTNRCETRSFLAGSMVTRLLLFHHALQWVLVLACKIHHLRHLGLG